MDLQVTDIVQINWGGSEYIEKVEGYCSEDGLFETSNFFIRKNHTASYHRCPSSFTGSVKKIWRFDEYGNYIRIYPKREAEEKEGVDDFSKYRNYVKNLSPKDFLLLKGFEKIEEYKNKSIISNHLAIFGTTFRGEDCNVTVETSERVD